MADQTSQHHPDGAYVELHRTIKKNITLICALNARLEEAIINGDSCAYLTTEAKNTALLTQGLLRRYSNIITHATSAVERSERRLNQQELQTAFHSALKQLEATAQRIVPMNNDQIMDDPRREVESISEDDLISVSVKGDDLQRELIDTRARYLSDVKDQIDDIRRLYQEMSSHVDRQGHDVGLLENQVIQASDYSHLANQQLILAREQATKRAKRILAISSCGVGAVACVWYILAMHA